MATLSIQLDEQALLMKKLAEVTWDRVRDSPEASVFFTALLLHGRWSK